MLEPEGKIGAEPAPAPIPPSSVSSASAFRLPFPLTSDLRDVSRYGDKRFVVRLLLQCTFDVDAFVHSLQVLFEIVQPWPELIGIFARWH